MTSLELKTWNLTVFFGYIYSYDFIIRKIVHKGDILLVVVVKISVIIQSYVSLN